MGSCANHDNTGIEGMPNMIEITIPEAVMPAVRMTQRSKWVDPAAIAYLSNKQTLKWYMRQAMEAGGWEMFDKKTLCVKLKFFVTELYTNDIDNLAKSVLDAAQKIVYKNDNYINMLIVTRALSKEPSVTMRIRELC
jgi:Holliday junction resolvase RusA-like endonuclease